jgi:hypothetical protein
MARKSQALRTQEARDLLAAFRTDGFDEGEWSVKFLASVVSQMDHGRYPTKKQRDRIDAMIVEGIPKPKGDTELLAKMDAAVAYWTAANEREWECKVLTDMRRRVFNDWNLSGKQIKLLNDIIQRHEDDLSGVNVFIPTVEERADLEVLVKLYRGYSGQWTAERPAVRKAVDRVLGFLQGENTIEEYHFTKLNKAMGAKLRRFKTPRFNACDIAKFVESINIDGTWTKITHIATVMTDTYVDERGRIVNDFLLPTGDVRTLEAERCGKFRKRKSD